MDFIVSSSVTVCGIVNKASSRMGDVVSTEAWSGLEQLAKNAYSIITYHLHGLTINTYVKF